jgi:hypothetical protein
VVAILNHKPPGVQWLIAYERYVVLVISYKRYVKLLTTPTRSREKEVWTNFDYTVDINDPRLVRNAKMLDAS